MAPAPSPAPSSSAPVSWDSAEPLLKSWLTEVTNRENSHRDSAKKRRYPAWILGAISTILNSAVGISFFTAWQQKLDTVDAGARVWILTISFSAAICSALLTTLRLSERSERHLILANECHSLRIEMGYHIACPPASTDLRKILESLRTRMAALGVDD